VPVKADHRERNDRPGAGNGPTIDGRARRL